jgi:hypothetical protein
MRCRNIFQYADCESAFSVRRRTSSKSRRRFVVALHANRSNNYDLKKMPLYFILDRVRMGTSDLQVLPSYVDALLLLRLHLLCALLGV